MPLDICACACARAPYKALFNQIKQKCKKEGTAKEELEKQLKTSVSCTSAMRCTVDSLPVTSSPEDFRERWNVYY